MFKRARARALRGAAALKARALKEVWNITAVIPVERGTIMKTSSSVSSDPSTNGDFSEGLGLEENFLDSCLQELLTRVPSASNAPAKVIFIGRSYPSIYMEQARNHAKKKSDIANSPFFSCNTRSHNQIKRDVQSWPGRHLFEGGEATSVLWVEDSNSGNRRVLSAQEQKGVRCLDARCFSTTLPSQQSGRTNIKDHTAIAATTTMAMTMVLEPPWTLPILPPSTTLPLLRRERPLQI
ncbi:auxin canalization protein [Actinidia rufa]|uniref:Auxin canalization protein n=1 Tax=Actinidia rufa TaxID=165716 RepID=A0A7J0H9T8_9ERIC|nr:auxin canalization protein [Actinidia rufa]